MNECESAGVITFSPCGIWSTTSEGGTIQNSGDRPTAPAKRAFRHYYPHGSHATIGGETKKRGRGVRGRIQCRTCKSAR